MLTSEIGTPSRAGGALDSKLGANAALGTGAPGSALAPTSALEWASGGASALFTAIEAELGPVMGPGAPRAAPPRAQLDTQAMDALHSTASPNRAQSSRRGAGAFTARRKGRKVSILRR